MTAIQPSAPGDDPVGVIQRFYAAFQARDGQGMAACYHPQARFQDPIFDLDSRGVGQMWRMLTAAGKDLKLEVSALGFDGQRGHARWEARYTFSATGRRVHNIVRAEFEFREGLIVAHTDRFSFWRWSRQALGPIGLLLGWSPWLQAKVRGNAAKGLAAWAARFDKPGA